MKVLSILGFLNIPADKQTISRDQNIISLAAVTIFVAIVLSACNVCFDIVCSINKYKMKTNKMSFLL